MPARQLVCLWLHCGAPLVETDEMVATTASTNSDNQQGGAMRPHVNTSFTNYLMQTLW